MRFELTGFAPVERGGIRVSVNVVTTIDQRLGLAAVSETLTVSGFAPAVDTKSTSRGTNFDDTLLQTIPQARRSGRPSSRCPAPR